MQNPFLYVRKNAPKLFLTGDLEFTATNRRQEQMHKDVVEDVV